MPTPPPLDPDDHDALVERRLARAFPHYGSPELKPVQLAEVYARMVALAEQRVILLGELLAERYAEEGLDALIGHRYAAATVGRGGGVQDLETVAVSEETRALAAMEGAERDRLERLTREAIKLGIEAQRVDVMRSYGRTVAEVTRQMAHELGLDWGDPATRRVAQRAVLAARAKLGYEQRSPETVGPRLTDDERERLLGGPEATPFDA